MGADAAAVRFEGGALSLMWPGQAGWSELRFACRLGDGTEVEGNTWTGDGDGLFTVRAGPTVAQLRLECDGVQVRVDLKVEALDDLAITELRLAGRVLVGDSPPEWLLYDGYQSWDRSGYVSAKGGRRESWWTAGLATASGAGLAATALSATRSSIRFELEEGLFSAVWAERSGLVPHPALWTSVAGSERELEALVIAAGAPVTSVLRSVLGSGGHRAEVPRGWLSWYHFGPWVSKDHVLQNSARLVEGAWKDLGHKLIQIDDGWQVAYGDWFENEKFQPGLQHLSAELAGRGQITGVWTAPFLVSASADLATNAPENWFVQDPVGGRRAVDPRHVAFGPMHILDAGNPEVQAHLETTFSRLRAAGIDYFKIDFLYAGAYAGTAALRSGVEAIRRGVGEAYLLACGAPLLPMVGLVDGCRIGADTATPIYDFETERPKPAIFGEEILAVGRNVAARHFMEGWFHLDADVALVGGNLELEQGRQLVTVAVLSGGPFFSSDDLDSLPPERLRLLDNPEVLEMVGGPTAVPDWEPNSADRPPSVWRRGEEVVAVFNWTPAPREHTLRIPGGVEVRDIWLREALDAAGDSVRLELPAHGVRLLRLSSA